MISNFDGFTKGLISLTFMGQDRVELNELVLGCVTQSLACDISNQLNSTYSVSTFVNRIKDEVKSKFSVVISSSDLQSIILKLKSLSMKIILGKKEVQVSEEIVYLALRIHSDRSYWKYEMEISQNTKDFLVEEVAKMEDLALSSIVTELQLDKELEENKKLKEENSKLNEVLSTLNIQNGELCKQVEALKKKNEILCKSIDDASKVLSKLENPKKRKIE